MFMYGYWYLSGELKQYNNIVQRIITKFSFVTGVSQKVYYRGGTGENQEEEKGEEIARINEQC